MRNERAEELLKASMFAFNCIRNHKLHFPGSKDTYTLASEISRFFKDVEEGAYKEKDNA